MEIVRYTLLFKEDLANTHAKDTTQFLDPLSPSAPHIISYPGVSCYVIYKLPLIRLILHQVSPQLVIAYAIAGRIDIDFEREPLGYAYTNGSPVFLSEIWPSQKEVRQAEHGLVIPAIFR